MGEAQNFLTAPRNDISINAGSHPSLDIKNSTFLLAQEYPEVGTACFKNSNQS